MSEQQHPGLTTIFDDKRATKRRLRKTKLSVLSGADQGKEYTVEKERVTIGRSLICDLTLEDRAVSGTHCEIVADEKGFILRDLGSTNGTYVGDVRVREAFLEPNMVVRVGQSNFKFESAKGAVEIELSAEDRFQNLVGSSVKMREVFATLGKVAPTDLTVMVRGETGTGKELVSRALHEASKRADAPLVIQDCSAIPKDLIESTLFGHEKGSFTGAARQHQGCFEQADGGTIFLDEIGELDISLQPKLLRVLENREIMRVGGDKRIPVNVRVIAATNRDLRAMVNDGTFREDLFYRLSVIQIELPALRERGKDPLLLAESFLDRMAKIRFPGEDKKFVLSESAQQRITGYGWPGNVRELKNTIERAAALSDGVEIDVQDLMMVANIAPPQPIVSGDVSQFVEGDVPFKEAKQAIVDTFEAAYLKALLEKHDDNITRSAQAAGLTRYHLRELAKRYGLRDYS